MAIAAPRSFAKSTVFSFIYPLWSVLYKKKKDILLVSATGSLAEEWLRRIKTELEINPQIIEDFGNVKSDKWTEAHIILNNNTQVRAKGAGYQIRGFRPDAVVVDDIENDESVRSEDQRQKLEDWFWTALVNTLEPTSQLIVVGTLLHPLSFLTKLIDSPKPGWVTKKYKAIKDDGTALWPEKWPLNKLEERKIEIGERRFLSEFMNDPLADDDVVFRREWVDNRTVSDYPPLREMTIYTAVDPAISKTDISDYTAIVTVGVHNVGVIDKDIPKDRYGHIYVLEAKRGRWSVYETVSEIIATYNRFRPKQILCEEVAYQAALKEVTIKEARRENLYLPVHAVQADKDKIRRAGSVSHMVEQGIVHLMETQEILRSELMTFPSGEHDDMVDAFVYALSAASGNLTNIKSASAKIGRKRYSDIFDIDRAIKPKRKAWYNL